MDFITKIAIYYFVGVISTILQVVVVRLISKERAAAASIVVFISNLVQLGVLVSIISSVQSDIQSSWPSLLVYSFGIATGTYLGIKLKLEKTT
jgi:hypothetical protein